MDCVGRDFEQALEEWRDTLGPEHVLTDAAALAAARSATFLTSQSIPAL